MKYKKILKVLTRNQSEIRIQCHNVYTTSVEYETNSIAELKNIYSGISGEGDDVEELEAVDKKLATDMLVVNYSKTKKES